VKVASSPYAFTYSDELTHAYNVEQILNTRRPFHPTPLVDITPLYPSLANVGAALSSLSGLSVFQAGIVVAGAARTRRTLSTGGLFCVPGFEKRLSASRRWALSVGLSGALLPVLVTALLSAEVNAYFLYGLDDCRRRGPAADSPGHDALRRWRSRAGRAGATNPAYAPARRTRRGHRRADGGRWGRRHPGHLRRNYAEQAGLTLRLLTIAVLPLLIKNHYNALFRVHRRIRAAAVAVALGAGLEVGGATVGTRLGGIPGLSIGWLAGLSLEAAWMLPSVWRTARG